MDLGASVCSRRNPACTVCPLFTHCQAAAQGRQHELPEPKAAARARKPRRRDRCVMLLASDAQGRVLLEQRPATGIWGGLWSLPQFDDEDAARLAAARLLRQGDVEPLTQQSLHHTFTHFDLEIVPLRVRCASDAGVADGATRLWFDPRDPARVGLPAPVKILIEGLESQADGAPRIDTGLQA
jgi:A/G-specific adenine glycosylase